MLIKQPQIRIVSRPMTLATGEAVLAYFALVNIEGHVEVRFLGTRPTAPETAEVEAILALPEPFKHASYGHLKAPASPYAVVFASPLLFLKNQLARAPSHN